MGAPCTRYGTPVTSSPRCRRRNTIGQNGNRLLKTRHQQISETRADPIRKLWCKLRETQQEHSQRSAIALASGIQCNGLPTFLAYKELTSKPHLFFDTRVTSDMLATPDQVSKRCFQNRMSKKLRLTFSGRLSMTAPVEFLLSSLS